VRRSRASKTYRMNRIAFVGLCGCGDERINACRLRQPDLVRCVRREVVRVPLDDQASAFENLTESFAEVASVK